VDEIKFLIANICLQNSKMGVLKIRGFIMFMLFYDIKKKQNAQKSKTCCWTSSQMAPGEIWKVLAFLYFSEQIKFV